MIFRKKILFIIILATFLVIPASLSAMVEVGGVIYNDTTWSNADTIHVVSTVVVDTTATLTIQPGTVVLFSPNTSLRIRDQLYAEGEQTDKIMFTSIADTSGGSPNVGSWTGIRFYDNSSGVLRHCHIRYALYGVQTSAAPVEFYDCLVENFSVRGFYIDGVFSDPHTPTIIERCVARQEEVGLIGRGTGIYVYRLADVYISRCRVYNCQTGIDFNAHSAEFPIFNIVRCDIRDNLRYGIWVQSCG